jgi:hypothetical protein
MSSTSVFAFSPAGDYLTTNSLLQPSNSKWKSYLLYAWRFIANQFFLATSPLRLTRKEFFFNWTLAVIVLCNILSDEKMCLSLIYMLGFSSSVRIEHMACCRKFVLLHYILVQVLCQHRLFKADHVPPTYLMLQLEESQAWPPPNQI